MGALILSNPPKGTRRVPKSRTGWGRRRSKGTTMAKRKGKGKSTGKRYSSAGGARRVAGSAGFLGLKPSSVTLAGVATLSYVGVNFAAHQITSRVGALNSTWARPLVKAALAGVASVAARKVAPRHAQAVLAGGLTAAGVEGVKTVADKAGQPVAWLSGVNVGGEYGTGGGVAGYMGAGYDVHDVYSGGMGSGYDVHNVYAGVTGR